MGKPYGPGDLSPSKEKKSFKNSSPLGITLNILFFSLKTKWVIASRSSNYLVSSTFRLEVRREEKREPFH